MAWDCGAGYFFVLIWSRHLVHSVFPFLVTTAWRTSKWKNNRRCATICINIGGSLHPAPVGNASRTQASFRGFFRFLAHGLLARHQSWRHYYWGYIRNRRYSAAHCLLFFTLPILWAVLGGNGKRFLTRWRPNEKTKEHQAPQSQAIFYN